MKKAGNIIVVFLLLFISFFLSSNNVYAGSTCSSNADVDNRTCSGNGYVVCEKNYNQFTGTTTYSWSSVRNCASGNSCVNGTCYVTCPNGRGSCQSQSSNCNQGSFGPHYSDGDSWCSELIHTEPVCCGPLPNCTTGTTSCGSCSKTCGGGTQTCYHNSISGGGACARKSFSHACNTQACCAYSSNPTIVSLTHGTITTTTIPFSWNTTNSTSTQWCMGSTCHTGLSSDGSATAIGLTPGKSYSIILKADNCHAGGPTTKTLTVSTLDPAQLTFSVAGGSPVVTSANLSSSSDLGNCNKSFSIPKTCTSDRSDAKMSGTVTPNGAPSGYSFTKFTGSGTHTTVNTSSVVVNMDTADTGSVTANYACITPPQPPTIVTPSGIIHNTTCITPPTQRVSWTAPAAVTNMVRYYRMVVTDTTPGIVPPSPVIINSIANTYYDYAFTMGHAYNVKVYTQNSVCTGSVSSSFAQTNLTFNTCILGNVFIDYNGNHAQDPADSGYPNKKITNSPPVGGITQVNTASVANPSTTPQTNIGDYRFTDVTPSANPYRISIELLIVHGVTEILTTPASQPVPVLVHGPNPTANFSVQPPAPTCTLSLITATPNKVNPDPATGKNTAILSVTCTPSVPGQPLTYTWYPDPGLGTVANSGITGPPVTAYTQTDLYTAPFPFWQDKYTRPSVTVCNPGVPVPGRITTSTQTCTGATVSLTGLEIVPLFSIAGNVYLDDNKDKKKDGAEANYTAGSIIVNTTPSVAGSTITYAGGTYKISNLPAGTYTVKYNNGPPNGFALSYLNAFSVTVGNNNTPASPPHFVCSTLADQYGGALCDNVSNQNDKGNISNLNFGITDSFPWTQCFGGNCTMKSGDYVPAPPPSIYASNDKPGPVDASTKGYIYLPNQPSNQFSFCPLLKAGGSPMPCLDRAGTSPAWVIGQKTSYTFDKSAIDTSFASVNIKYGKNLVTLTTPTLSPALAAGAYIIKTAVGGSLADVELNNGLNPYAFAAGTTHIILAKNINIKSNITVARGAILLLVAQGNINIDKSVTNLEGWYSSDGNILIQSKGDQTSPPGRLVTGVGSNCYTTIQTPNDGPDNGLTVNGNLITGAAGVGSLTNNRDLCLANKTTPALKVTQRLDFVVNAPPQLIDSARSWREVAP